jgi:hypothetical protein
MKKKTTRTEMQKTKLKQECSAAWGGGGKTAPSVAFRGTATAKDSIADIRREWKQWPLTAEEEEIFCKTRGA